MYRSFMISLSKAEWAKNIVTNWRPAWRAASRFIAGEKLEDAILAIQGLNKKGINATLDHLGEHTTNDNEAAQATTAILDMVPAIVNSGVQANISIKLSQIGLGLDDTVVAENLRRILDRAGENGVFVRIDMEDSSTVEETLELLHTMREKEGFSNFGVVIQSYLYRSDADIRMLANNGIRVRLCKGAYKEPPEIAYPKKKDVDSNYDHLTKILVDGALSVGSPEISLDGRIPPIPAIASHDPTRLEYAKKYAQEVGLPKNAIEFQMLYGIRRDLQIQAIGEGYPVRVYVPYGTQWYPYYLRRLAERPANVWFFVNNVFQK
jgi:proline dehydrogenase